MKLKFKSLHNIILIARFISKYLVLFKWTDYKIKISKSWKTSSEIRRKIAEITPIRVTQGSTYRNDEQCCAAAHATDKDLSTIAATETNNGAGWLKLEFDKTYFVNKVIIYYRFYTNWYDNSISCVESIDMFKICADKDTNVDVSVYQGDVKQKACGTLQLTYGLEQSDQIYTLICNAKGDTLKLSKNTGNLAVYEVVVIGIIGKIIYLASFMIIRS